MKAFALTTLFAIAAGLVCQLVGFPPAAAAIATMIYAASRRAEAKHQAGRQ